MLASIRGYVGCVVVGEEMVKETEKFGCFGSYFDFVGVFEDIGRGFGVPYFCWSCLMCSLCLLVGNKCVWCILGDVRSG